MIGATAGTAGAGAGRRLREKLREGPPEAGASDDGVRRAQQEPAWCPLSAVVRVPAGVMARVMAAPRVGERPPEPPCRTLVGLADLRLGHEGEPSLRRS